MKKAFLILFFLSVTLLVSFTILLTSIGVETDKFNNIISQKIKQNNKNIDLKLNSISFKIDLKEISLFLETSNPQINYREAELPAKNIKVYIDFVSLVKSNLKIKKIDFDFNQIEIKQLKKITTNLKPSNLTSLINNKIKDGKIITEIEVYFDKNNLIENFIAKGKVVELKASVINNFNLEKSSFNFFADNTDLLLTNFKGQIAFFEIKEGDLKLNYSSEISLQSNFKTNLNYNSQSKESINLIPYQNFSKYISSLSAQLNNSFFIKFDKTYKVINYEYKNNGKITNAKLNFKDNFQNYFKEDFNQLYLADSEINTNIDKNIKKVNIEGKYSFDQKDFLKFSLKNFNKNDIIKLKLNSEFDKEMNLNFINYKKSRGSVSNILLDMDIKRKDLNINEIKFVEKKNLISLKGIKFTSNKLLSFNNAKVITFKEGKKNNDFSLIFDKKILLKGNRFDATNLSKIFKSKKEKNILSNISKKIEIDLLNIDVPMSERLKNFKLIGQIEKGSFKKISAKGDFGNNNFLDITLKNNNINKKSYLEIYSDMTNPLLSEYSFFNGLSGGKLLYTSEFNKVISNSKLKIENFKVVNAPGVVKLLSLADLGGLADLAEGEGISFEILEINMKKTKDVLELNEILALGPSLSVIMEGYQDSKTTSLRGTLVPAKTLNKVISKIPVLGDIVIPKEAGEGLFGVSFKLKGPQGNIKTTINPIRTITPRFIQKIIDKKKITK